MAKRTDPYRNYNFRITFEGRVVAGFRAVEVGTSIVEVVEYRDGGDPKAVRKVPGLHKTADVTLKRGLIDSKALFGWFRAVVNGEPNLRKDLEIALHPGPKVARFFVRNAWPTKVTLGELDAKGTDIAIETLELANDGFEPA
jgi:phage tail-like protein